MKKPGQDLSRNRLLNNARMRDLELRERSSRSLLANVLDLDDDFRITSAQQQQQQRIPLTNTSSNNHCPGSVMVSNPSMGNSTLQQNHQHRYSNYHPPSHQHNHNTAGTNTAYQSSHLGNHVHSGNKYEDSDVPSASNEVGNVSVFKDMLKEMKFLTDKLRRDEDFEEQCTDWKFAALVIDRLCLWIFTIFTISSTCAILFSAPHLFS